MRAIEKAGWRTAHQLTTVRLNYQPVSLVRQDGFVKFLSQSVRPVQSGGQLRLYLLDFIVRAQPDGWALLVRYSSTHHQEATIRQFVNSWRDRIAAQSAR